MKILALEKECPEATNGQFQPHLKPEAMRVWELYQKGIIREAYFHAEQHQAVLVLECSDMSEAHMVVESLPLVQAGMITFDLLPLIPYDGFARLFMPVSNNEPTQMEDNPRKK
jgi:hypothetical protein